jgi:hypothetical protein
MRSKPGIVPGCLLARVPGLAIGQHTCTAIPMVVYTYLMKLTIYVPDPLSQRLETVKEAINVSEVCQSALERAIAGVEAARLGDERSRIVERLRVARSPEQRAYDAGQGEGGRWASETAALDEIKRVVRWETVSYVETPGGTLGWRVGWLVPKARGPFAVVVDPFNPPEYEPGYVSIPTSFEPVTAKSLARLADYWNGFHAGVAAIYDLVKPDLGDTPSTPAPPSDSGMAS